MPKAKDILRAARARRQFETHARDAAGRIVANPLPVISLDGLPGKRSEALEKGSLYYYTGRACSYGHKFPRYASSGACLVCLREKGARGRRRSELERRKRVDDNTYTTGRPCIRGHMAPRRFSNGNCIECDREKALDTSRHLTEARNARARERYATDPEYRAKIAARRTPEWYERVKRQKREKYRTDSEYREKLSAARRGRDQRHTQLKTNYGITLVDYQRMLSEQDGVCAICRHPSEKTLHVDHNHETGTVRGLLCEKCNHGLGCFKDDEDILRRAMEYLTKCP